MSRGPESGTLRKLAAACGVNMLWLLEGVGPKRNGEPQSGNVHQLQPIGPTSKTNPLDPPTVLNADEMIELMALYQQSTDRGRRFIMESARVADKRPGAARWILAVNDNA